MKKILLAAALMSVLFAGKTFAQDDEAEDVRPFPYQQTFGLTASSTSGSGIYYRAALSQNMQVKVAGFIYFNESSNTGTRYYYGNDNYFIYNVGAELQRNIYASRNTRFYALAGVNYLYDRSSNNSYYFDPFDNSNPYADKNIYKTIRGGIGAGFEFVAWKHLSMNFEGSFDLHNTDTQYIPGNPTVQPSTGYERGVGLGGGIGIGYTF